MKHIKNINLVNWRNTKDDLFFNKFKKLLIASLVVFIGILLIFLLPLNMYRHNLMQQKQQIQAATKTEKTKLAKLVEFMQANSSDLAKLAIMQNAETSSNTQPKFFAILQELSPTDKNLYLAELNKIDNLIIVKGFVNKEDNLQKYIAQLQKSKIFSNVRLVDLQAFTNRFDKAEFELELEIQTEIHTENLLEPSTENLNQIKESNFE